MTRSACSAVHHYANKISSIIADIEHNGGIIVPLETKEKICDPSDVKMKINPALQKHNI